MLTKKELQDMFATLTAVCLADGAAAAVIMRAAASACVSQKLTKELFVQRCGEIWERAATQINRVEGTLPAETVEAVRLTGRKSELETIVGIMAREIVTEMDDLRSGPPIGFALLVFDFGENGFLAYASNAERRDMIRSLREQADRMEEGLKGSN